MRPKGKKNKNYNYTTITTMTEEINSLIIIILQWYTDTNHTLYHCTSHKVTNFITTYIHTSPKLLGQKYTVSPLSATRDLSLKKSLRIIHLLLSQSHIILFHQSPSTPYYHISHYIITHRSHSVISHILHTLSSLYDFPKKQS